MSTFDAVGGGTGFRQTAPTSPLDIAAGSLALTIGSGSNRALVVQLCFENAVTSVGVVWDQGGTNQAMTQIGSQSVSGGSAIETVLLFGLVAPTSGNNALRVTWTGTAGEIMCQGVSWTAVDQTGSSTTFPPFTNFGTSSSPSVTITSATNDAVMAVFAAGQTFGMSSVDNTQTMLLSGATSLEGGGNRAAGASSVTLGATLTGSDPWAAVGTNIKTFGASGPTINTQPANAIVYAGQTATFNITATTSGGTLHYQWKVNGSNVGTDTNSYTTPATTLSDDNSIITCVVSDNNGSTTSNNAYLDVLGSAITWLWKA